MSRHLFQDLSSPWEVTGLEQDEMKHKKRRTITIIMTAAVPWAFSWPDKDPTVSYLIFTETLCFSKRKLELRKVKNVACPPT